MICSASQIDSFWNTLVLSNDCESSMRAIVIEPPRFGVAALLESGVFVARAAAPPVARRITVTRNAKALRRRGTGGLLLRTATVAKHGGRDRNDYPIPRA